MTNNQMDNEILRRGKNAIGTVANNMAVISTISFETG
jgi:hypothetical protein